MTKSFVQNMVTCLNMLPSRNGISNDLSLEVIILGAPKLDYNKLKIMCRAYEKVHIVTTNNTKQKTVRKLHFYHQMNGKGITSCQSLI